MKSRILLSLPVLGTLFFASCYPIQDGRPGGPRGPRGADEANKKTVTSPDQQELQKQRDAMKKKAQQKKSQASKPKPTKPTPGTTNNTTVEKKPVEKKTTGYKFANPVPGKDGFVFSPYNNKLVDVRDIPSGTLVQDPTYPASEKKYFRVP